MNKFWGTEPPQEVHTKTNAIRYYEQANYIGFGRPDYTDKETDEVKPGKTVMLSVENLLAADKEDRAVALTIFKRLVFLLESKKNT